MILDSRRFIVVPDAAFDNATVVSITATGDGSRQEAGRQVDQPDRDAALPPTGDIALTLTGEPEVHVEGTVRNTRGGVVEDGRYAWARAEDNHETDLQLRQSPHVVGRRPDLVKYTAPSPAAASYRSVRPRLLSLKSGDALMVWTERFWSPIWGRNTTAIGGGAEQIYTSKLDHTEDTWGVPDNSGVIPFDILSEFGQSAIICAVDITQFPDTGEIVMCVATCKTMTPASVAPRILWVYVSFDDATSWVLRHRLHFDGAIPDIVLDFDGDGAVDDATAIQDWALELLDSGRLCLLMVTENYTWSLTSDDRGASWGVTEVAFHGVTNRYVGHGAGCTKARNGMACFVTALRETTTNTSETNLRFTRDGQTWSSPIEIPGGTQVFQTADVTVCISPDGWPHIYGTEHAYTVGGVTPQDWMWGRRLKTRDPGLADGESAVYPYLAGVCGPAGAFHIPEGGAAGSYVLDVLEPFDPPAYGGFVGIDAILHRGQVLMAVTAIKESAQAATYIQTTLKSSALMVYRLNHWQPIQEQLGNVLQGTAYAPAAPALGRVYNRTWDCYGDPVNWGFAATGGAGTIVAGGAEGGYFKVTGAPHYWSDTSLPVSAVTETLDAAIRLVLHVETGGDLTADEIACQLRLVNGAGNRSDISIRFERDGADIKIRLYDNVAAALFGTEVTLDGTGWIEVLYAQQEVDDDTYSVTAAVRHYPRATDPDWDEPYTMLTEDNSRATTAAAGELLRFGHVVSGDPESWWKGVHLHRGNSDGECDLVQCGTTYVDNDATNDRTLTGTAEPPLDNGLDNYMRTSRMLSDPPNFLERAINARFRGEALTEGNFDFTTGYAYAARSALIQPVLREWRSVDDDVELAIVLEDASGRGFRPDAVAVFGHNVAGFTFQFNDTDTWGSPLVSFQLCVPTISVLPDRYIHEWAADPLFSLTYLFDSAGKTLLIDGGIAPWRPHQFKSDPGGQQHYFGRFSNSRLHVFRIIDNTANTLFIDVDVTTVGFSMKGSGVIFSDRFACMVGHHFDPDPLVTYPFCRILIRRTKHWDTDAQFSRIGRIVLGTTVELSTPDFEKGWSVGFEDGSELVSQPTGADYTHSVRALRRVWQADRPWMMPPAEASGVFVSPSAQETRASWAQWIDTVRRIDGVKTACAFIWQGERFVGFDGEERVQCCADPMSLAMCHVTGIGDMENLIYDGRTANLAEGETCIPVPVSHIRGLRFSETF